MVEIRQIREDSLLTIPEEGTESTESHGTSYTCTLIDPYGQEFLAFPPSFRGAMMSPPRDGETNQERDAQEERNVDHRAWRVNLENAEEDVADTAAGGQRDICRDLTDAFDMCDNR
jgi:hypothetical protein